MATTTLYAASHVTGSATTPNNALGAPDGTFTTDVDNVSWTSRWQMSALTLGAATATQSVTFRVRKQTGSGTPTVTITMWENGTQKSTLATNSSVTSLTGQDLTYNFTLEETYGPAVQFQLAVSAVGGSPANRATVQLDGITWNVTYDAFKGSAFQGYSGGTWNPGFLRYWSGSQWIPAQVQKYNGSTWDNVP